MTASLQTSSTLEGDATAGTVLAPLPSPLSSHSRFVQRLRRRYAAELNLLPKGTPTRATMQITFEVLQARGDNVADALRTVRQ